MLTVCEFVTIFASITYRLVPVPASVTGRLVCAGCATHCAAWQGHTGAHCCIQAAASFLHSKQRRSAGTPGYSHHASFQCPSRARCVWCAVQKVALTVAQACQLESSCCKPVLRPSFDQHLSFASVCMFYDCIC